MVAGEGLEVEGLEFAYAGSARPVVSVEELRLEAPFFLVILGPNGAGKTTLLKLLLGLLKPARGRVRLLGVDPHSDEGRRRLAGRVGYVPQLQRVNTRIPLRGWEVAAMRLYLSSRPPRPELRRFRRAALEALEALGVRHLECKPFSEMSGGERQLVLLARAIAGGPSLLVADEPIGMVDPARRGEVVRALWRLHTHRGLSVILTTHDITPFLQPPIARGAVGALMNRRIVRLAPLGELLADQESLALTFGEYTGLDRAIANVGGGAG
jgi:ABC-type Mn2+/Zn2+ transport system ATPase subunit